MSDHTARIEGTVRAFLENTGASLDPDERIDPGRMAALTMPALVPLVGSVAISLDRIADALEAGETEVAAEIRMLRDAAHPGY